MRGQIYCWLGSFRGSQEERDAAALARGDGLVHALPSVSDPKLWVVKCKRGMGPGIVIALMNKFVALAVSAAALRPMMCGCTGTSFR